MNFDSETGEISIAKGIAKELLSRVVNEAREYGCGVIQITASDMGVKLYTDFGFVHKVKNSVKIVKILWKKAFFLDIIIFGRKDFLYD